MTKLKIDFATLKESITPEITGQMLDRLGVLPRFSQEDDGSFRGGCPFEGQQERGTGENKKESPKGRSFKITKDGRAWFCHDKSCACLPVNEKTGQPVRGGNMLDFVRFKQKGTVREAGEFLHALISQNTAKAQGRQNQKESEAQEGVEAEGQGKSLDNSQGKTATSPAQKESPNQDQKPKPTHNLTFEERGYKPLALSRDDDLILSLGLDPDAFALHGAGIATRGMMKGRLTFPITNKDGKLIAYGGRKLSGEGEIWKFPEDFQPFLEVVGIDNLFVMKEQKILSKLKTVIVTFDLLSAARLFGDGEDSSLAVLVILSVHLSKEQEELIAQIAEDLDFSAKFIIEAEAEIETKNGQLINELVLFLSRLAYVLVR